MNTTSHDISVAYFPRVAFGVPLAANAQLTSVDNGLAATDRTGLMWANTVGIPVF
jgi:hypothetical protein